MDHLKMYFLLIMGIFHCHVSLPECNSQHLRLPLLKKKMVQVLHPGKFSHGTWFSSPVWKGTSSENPPPFFGVPTVNLPGVKPPLKPIHQIPPRSTPAHPSGTCRRAWGFLVCLEIDSLPHEHPSPPKTNGWISKMMVWKRWLLFIIWPFWVC